jgi:cell division protein FtsZ
MRAESPTEHAAPVQEAREQKVGWGAPPELVPVPASVFDDDFFRAPAHEESATEMDREESGFRETARYSAPVRVQHEDVRSLTEVVSAGEPSVREPSFGTAGVHAADHSVPDELDIPAFLRRGN